MEASEKRVGEQEKREHTKRWSWNYAAGEKKMRNGTHP